MHAAQDEPRRALALPPLGLGCELFCFLDRIRHADLVTRPR
ncbi:MAG: hypothetical protein QOF45_198 [Gaiellaceae bacterium]|nr:hypothetical protein [Gaiellaceae bacterium]